VLKKLTGCDSSGFGASYVFDVGNFAFNHVAIFVPKGKLDEALVGVVGTGEEFLFDIVTGSAHEGGGHTSCSGFGGSGEGGKVENQFGGVLLGVVEGIGQYH